MQHLRVHSLGRVSDPCCLNRRRRARRRRGPISSRGTPRPSQIICAQKARVTAAGEWTGGGRPFGYPPRWDGVGARRGWRRSVTGVASGAGWGACLRDHKSWQAEVPPVRGGTWHRGRTFSLRSA